MISGECGKNEPSVWCAEVGRYPRQCPQYDGGHDGGSDPYQLDYLRSRGPDDCHKGKSGHHGSDPL